MRIAIYGGSFNPPHLGHREAAMTVARQLEPDLFLIVPDNLPHHKHVPESGPAPEERLELCRLAFGDVPGAVLSDLELRREGKSYTAETIERLRCDYPADELLLVLGTDMLLRFSEWYRFRYLIENCTLVILARSDEEREQAEWEARRLEEEEGAKVLFLPHEPLAMSSGELRGRLERRMGADALQDKVYAQIIRRRWYGAQPELGWLRERAYELLEPERIAHVAGCESEAVKLAMRWGEDPELAAEAAILHDCTKKLSLDQQVELSRTCGLSLGDRELSCPNVLHAITGAAYARERFGVSDVVYGAIRWHTTGRPDMSLLEKIVYLADMIEPTRDYPCVDQLRKICYTDLDEAMRQTLDRTIQHVRERGLQLYYMTEEAYRWYSARQ